MGNLQIKGIDDEFYDHLKQVAKGQGRSVSQQVLVILKDYMAKKELVDKLKTPASVLLDLSGSWLDEREADEIIEHLRRARKSSPKLRRGF